MVEENKKSKISLILIALLAKSTKLLKLAKLFKVAKPLVLLVSMSISVIAYAFMLGPWLSVLFVLLLLVHEMGHVVAMRIKGYETPTPVFIPFVGALIFAPRFKDRHSEAFVGYGGPLLGSIASLIVFAIWAFMKKDTEFSHILIVASYLGVYLNLFNMIPISPLDGGRITQAAGGWFKYLGLAVLAGFSVWLRQPVVLYIWIVVLFDLTIIQIKPRATLSTLLWISMATLMSMGYGDQPWQVNLLDSLITIPLVGRLVKAAIDDEEMVEVDQRPDLHPNEKVEWFALYILLIIALVAVMVVQLQFLPKI